jgi:pimeloyl-ACP methyl ester carboxylesterase
MAARPWLRRALALGGAGLLVAALVGATYQGIATALDRRALPHPGRLVDVGGHQLHLYCAGSGAPTVVLEGPAAGTVAVWGWVQPPLAGLTRVCSYDRAGLGWSEAGDGPYQPARVPDELRVLLDRAGERPPFILAGHGLGAAFARSFASRFPRDTAALVLIDSPADSAPRPDESLTMLMAASPWLARVGMLRLVPVLSPHADGLPEGWARDAARAFLNRPDHLTRAAREIALWDRAVALAAGAGPVPATSVEAAGPAPLALLDDREEAEPVVDAVRRSVGRTRKGH